MKFMDFTENKILKGFQHSNEFSRLIKVTVLQGTFQQNYILH